MDFIGRENLLKHKENGIKKKLCMLTVETSDVDPEGNETIWFGGKVEFPSLVLAQQLYSSKFARCSSLLEWENFPQNQDAIFTRLLTNTEPVLPAGVIFTSGSLCYGWAIVIIFFIGGELDNY